MSSARYQCFISLFLLCFSITAYAQLDASIVTKSIPVNNKYSADSAKIALEKGTAELIVLCGTAPIYSPRQTRAFKKKYGVGYEVFGDMIDGTPREMRLFNYAIFKWLDDNYGKGWVNDVRKDVCGLDKWVLYQDAIPYFQCDNKPSFNGGTINDFNYWVINHMELDESQKVSGSVTVRVLLSEDGEVIDVDDIGILMNSSLTRSYIEAIKNAPKWTPASHEGKPCKVVLSIRSDIDYR